MKLYSALLVLITMMLTCHAEMHAEQSSRSRQWLARPWEIRYILFVDRDRAMKSRIGMAKEINSASIRTGGARIYLDAEEIYEVTKTYSVAGQDALATVLIQFDREGHATSSSARLSTFSAKRSLLDALVLVRTNSQDEQPYYFADWAQGIAGAEHFSPAVCAGYDSMRYGEKWTGDYYPGNFGCREWTAQLYQSERSYIDVTSYAKHGNFIGQFVGWSRFSDPPKPVIGAQGKTWLCLLECPARENPGVIPDIKAWTRKHGFPMPDQPLKQPEYPNSLYKDDINE